MVSSLTGSSPLRPYYATNEPYEKLRELVHHATLAASSHNTQCWKFQLDDDLITVFPDLGKRRCPVVDPDDHHLYCSLGCAVENLVVAAHARGYTTAIDASSPELGIRVFLKETTKRSDLDLFQAIPERQVSKCLYDGKPLSETELEELEAAGTGNGVRVILVTDHNKKKEITEQIILANTLQLNNPAFMQELVTWARFNEREAVKKGDGLYGACMGNPQLPRILGNLIFPFVAKPGSENKKILKQIDSSAGFAMFVSEKNDATHWVEVGRCYERFALKATTLGIRNAFLNPPVEEAGVRPTIAKILGLEPDERPDLIVRFGKGPTMPFSPRRPIEDVIIYR